MMVRQTSDPSPKTDSDFEDDRAKLTRPIVSQEAEKAYTESYFRHFHHRWPIVHQPSYNEADHRLPLLCAISMIGAWEMGNGGSEMYAMVMQDFLTARLPLLLVSSPYCTSYCRACNILIYGDYSKREHLRIVSKGRFRQLYVRQHCYSLCTALILEWVIPISISSSLSDRQY